MTVFGELENDKILCPIRGCMSHMGDCGSFWIAVVSEINRAIKCLD